VALGALTGLVVLLALACHVDPRNLSDGSPYIPLLGIWPGDKPRRLGTAVVVAICLAAGWWTGFLGRLLTVAGSRPWAALGFAIAWLPFVAFGVLLQAGVYPPTPSLPLWIGAPWKAGPNLGVLARSVALIVGSDPNALETVLGGQGVPLPGSHWPALVEILRGLSPLCVAISGLSIYRVLKGRKRELTELASLSRAEPASPEGLAILYVAVTVGLFLLQGTSPDGSSVRYLVPLGAILPGLVGVGILQWPRKVALIAGVGLAVGWTGAAVEVWGEINRDCPARTLANELVRREVPGIIAPTPVALLVANLSSGRVGAVEYRPLWPRLGDRYSARVSGQTPVVCVTDRLFPWSVRDGGQWAQRQDLARHLRILDDRLPGSVHKVGSVGTFDIWTVDWPPGEILKGAPEAPATAASLRNY